MTIYFKYEKVNGVGIGVLTKETTSFILTLPTYNVPRI